MGGAPSTSHIRMIGRAGLAADLFEHHARQQGGWSITTPPGASFDVLWYNGRVMAQGRRSIFALNPDYARHLAAGKK